MWHLDFWVDVPRLLGSNFVSRAVSTVTPSVVGQPDVSVSRDVSSSPSSHFNIARQIPGILDKALPGIDCNGERPLKAELAAIDTNLHCPNPTCRSHRY